jgi:hypothetical protein
MSLLEMEELEGLTAPDVTGEQIAAAAFAAVLLGVEIAALVVVT